MRHRRSAVAVLLGALLLLVVGAAPASADPARPGEYRSEVTGLDPEVRGVTARVVGGDSFLELTVERGVEVEVPGYEGEPYLRFLADGTVEENELAPTRFRNEDRYGTDVPEDADGDAEPRWVEVSSDGSHAWHDHRIHWMSPDAPPRLEGGEGRVQDWTVPIVVDGEQVEVTGTLDKVAGTSPLPWLALALVVGGAAWFVGRRRVAVAVPALTVVGGAIAAFVGWREVASQPASAGGSPLPLVLGLVALGLAVLGALLAALRKPVPADVCGLAGAAALGGWVLLRFSVLANPVLPTELAPNLDRLGTSLVLACAVTAAVLGVQGGAFATRRPVDEEGSPAATPPPAPAPG